MGSKERFREIRRLPGTKPSTEIGSLLTQIRDTSHQLLFYSEETLPPALSRTIYAIWFSLLPPAKAKAIIDERNRDTQYHRKQNPEYRPTYRKNSLSRIKGLELLEQAEMNIIGTLDLDLPGETSSMG